MRRSSETIPPALEGQRRRGLTTARIGKFGALLGLIALALAVPTVLPNAYFLAAGVVVLNYAVAATGWNFMGGFTGYISFGHAAYFGLGAYGTAILIDRLGLSPFVALILSVVVVTAVTVPVGMAALAVRDSSFVIVTIAFVLIMLLVAQGWSSFTGGSYGLVVPRPFPELLRGDHHRVFYYLYLALLIVSLIVWWFIDRSAFGLGLKAVREDEDKAQALGVPTFAYKLIAFVLSAAFTAAAGGMYALWFGDLDPIFQFSVLLGAYMVLMALVGGVRNVFGPVLGAITVGSALEYFKLSFGDTQFHLVATGLLLAAVVLFMPDGIIPYLQGAVSRLTHRGEASIREMTAAEALANERGDGTDESDSPAGVSDPRQTETHR